LELGGHLSDEEVGTVKPEYLLRCTLDMFASLKCDELDAFIMARQDRDKPEFTAKSKISKKGTLSEAALGERNKIRIAFDSRESKNDSLIRCQMTSASPMKRIDLTSISLAFSLYP